MTERIDKNNRIKAASTSQTDTDATRNTTQGITAQTTNTNRTTQTHLQTNTSKTNKQKAIIRLAPCPDYDIEGLESWLGDLARQGLLLQKNGIHFGFFCFTKDAPQSLSYRLEAAEHAKNIFADEGREPDEEKQDLYRQLGWEYIARHQNFYIFTSASVENELPRELNTDPTLQALTLNMIKKRQIEATIFPIVQFIALIALTLYEHGLLRIILAVGSPFILVWLVNWLFWLYTMLREVLHLAKLRKALRETGALNHHKNWKTQQKSNFLRAGISWGLTLLSLVCFWAAWQRDASDANRISIAEYSQNPPFATLTNFMGEENTYTYTYTPQSSFDDANTVVTWHDPLAPCNIEWEEVATISQDSKIALDAYYTVKYHQLATPWLANRLAKEYSESTKHGLLYTEPTTLANAPDADYFAIYRVHVGVTFIVQQGNNVVCVTFYDFNADNDNDITNTTAPFTLEECVAMVTESLVNSN